MFWIYKNLDEPTGVTFAIAARRTVENPESPIFRTVFFTCIGNEDVGDDYASFDLNWKTTTVRIEVGPWREIQTVPPGCIYDRLDQAIFSGLDNWECFGQGH